MVEDRAMVNPAWMDIFPNVRLVNLLASHSDHNYSFKFENAWFNEPELGDVVTEGWEL
ncbi:endonuclease/exonuclease/phosphatase family protein, partial [Trifolium medium]|nr:endonuclease/exonuclease/phosphatase family protein [Trifolium medium]